MDLNHIDQQQQQQQQHESQGGGANHGGGFDGYSYDHVQNEGKSGGREEVRGVIGDGEQGNVWYDSDL